MRGVWFQGPAVGLGKGNNGLMPPGKCCFEVWESILFQPLFLSEAQRVQQHIAGLAGMHVGGPLMRFMSAYSKGPFSLITMLQDTQRTIYHKRWWTAFGRKEFHCYSLRNPIFLFSC